MDAGVFYVVFGLVGAVIGFIYANYQANSKIVDLSDALEAAKKTDRKSAKKSQKKSEGSTDSAKQANQDLKKAKDEIKTLKKQIYDLKEASKATPQPEKPSKKDKKKKKKGNDDVVFTLREEIGELKAKLANAQETIAAAPKPAAVVEESEPEEDDPSASPEVQELKKSHREQIKALNAKHADAEREYKQKLKKTSSNVDKQRRRADNNDKAYKITQRQVDGLQERIAYLEKELRHAGSPAPVVAASVAPASETAEIPVHASMDDDNVGAHEAPTAVVDDSPAPGFLMTKEAEPNTIEISEDLADDLLAEADRSDAFETAHVDEIRSTAPLSAVDPSEVEKRTPISDEEDTSGNTEMLTPKALAEAGIVADEPSETSSVDDAWAEFDVD